MYAIVDIETTGGYAATNDITEIAIVLHDGRQITGRYETLIRPTAPIPYYIQVLTGISHDMVAKAPPFREVAEEIWSILKDRIFVAHNVNFDYSFLKHHLELYGHSFQAPKVCTVRLSKKVFPGLPSYSLGNLCRSLSIPIANRHRAGGDADATVSLFEQILSNNGLEHINQSIRKGSKEQFLPPNLRKEELTKLPYTPGVYYFHDQKGKVIYVGKAKNLKYRVSSHFTNNGPGRQRQNFLRDIHSITFNSCGTELMAFILESIEIKRLWPIYNSSQKRYTPQFGLYVYEDRNGYRRLVIDKQKKQLPPIYTFNALADGQRMLRQLISKHQLCPKLCFLQIDGQPCVGLADHTCSGACELREDWPEYNTRVDAAIDYMQQILPSYALVDEGKDPGEQSCILIEKGRFYGMGYIPSDASIHCADDIKTYIQTYPENDYIRTLVHQHADKWPSKKIAFQLA
jgi:DNA polymerase III subunit epsilon